MIWTAEIAGYFIKTEWLVVSGYLTFHAGCWTNLPVPHLRLSMLRVTGELLNAGAI